MSRRAAISASRLFHRVRFFFPFPRQLTEESLGYASALCEQASERLVRIATQTRPVDVNVTVAIVAVVADVVGALSSAAGRQVAPETVRRIVRATEAALHNVVTVRRFALSMKRILMIKYNFLKWVITTSKGPVLFTAGKLQHQHSARLPRIKNITVITCQKSVLRMSLCISR